MIEREDGVEISVRVQPNAKKEEIYGETDGALKIRLTASPREGSANKACVRFLSKITNVPKSKVVIQSGTKSREKRIRFLGLDKEQLMVVLKPLLGVA